MVRGTKRFEPKSVATIYSFGICFACTLWHISTGVLKSRQELRFCDAPSQHHPHTLRDHDVTVTSSDPLRCHRTKTYKMEPPGNVNAPSS